MSINPCKQFTDPNWQGLCSVCGYSYGQHWIAEQPEFRKDPAAVKLGRKGGQSKSPRKQAAVRANVAKARAAKQAKQAATHSHSQ